MTTGIIIQARMGSSRLPGKVLMDLHGKPMLRHVVDRALAVRGIDIVIVATSREERDKPIADLCAQWLVPCYRGSETDVLDRYFRAGALHKLKAMIRITADCPLLDPRIVQAVLLEFKRGCDYCSNVHPATYPDGLDVEVVSMNALERAWLEAADPFEREHVTPYIWRHPTEFKLRNVTDDSDRSDRRWTVDTAEDLANAQALLARQHPGTDYRKLL